MRALLVLTIGLAACFSSDPAATGVTGDVGATVEMTTDLHFSPATVTIHVGQAVRWHNGTTFLHTATGNRALAADTSHVHLPAGAQPFNSGDVAANGDYTHVFTVPGRYDYVCLPHESFGMRGTIIVE